MESKLNLLNLSWLLCNPATGIVPKEEALEVMFKGKVLKVQQFDPSSGFFHITGKCDQVSYGVAGPDKDHVIFIIQPDNKKLTVPADELNELVTILN